MNSETTRLYPVLAGPPPGEAPDGLEATLRAFGARYEGADLRTVLQALATLASRLPTLLSLPTEGPRETPDPAEAASALAQLALVQPPPAHRADEAAMWTLGHLARALIGRRANRAVERAVTQGGPQAWELLASLADWPPGAALLGWTDASPAAAAAPAQELGTSGPIRFESVELGQGDQLVERVAGVLSGRIATWGAEDRHPHDWLVRAYEGLRPSEAARSLAKAVARTLGNEDPTVVWGGVSFFQFAQDAPDEGRLAALLLQPGDLGRSRDPLGQSPHTLVAELGRAVACNGVRANAPGVLPVLRTLAVEPGDGLAVLAGLFDLDRGFLRDQVGAIVQANPEALAILLLNLALQREDPEPFVLGATASAGEPFVRSKILEVFSRRPDLRDAHLALLPTQ